MFVYNTMAKSAFYTGLFGVLGWSVFVYNTMAKSAFYSRRHLFAILISAVNYFHNNRNGRLLRNCDIVQNELAINSVA